MTKAEQPREDAERARAAHNFVDRIQAISQRHGMGRPLSPAKYEETVKETEQIFRGLRPDGGRKPE